MTMTMTQTQQWTGERIRGSLQGNDIRWLERAVKALYKRQTEQEKAIEGTVVLNEKGFTAVDAPYLTYVAKYLERGNHLSGKHIQEVRRRLLKYSNQLARIANGG